MMFGWFRSTSLPWVEEVLRLLEEKPLEWKIDGYHATHAPSGVRLWIENSPYADMILKNPTRSNPGRHDAYRIRKALHNVIAEQIRAKDKESTNAD